MRIAQLTRFVSRLNGGVFFAQVGLLPRLVRLASIDVRVFGAQDAFTAPDRGRWGPVGVEAFPAWPPATFGFSPRLLRALRAYHPDLTHVHGLWTYSSLASLRLQRQQGIPIVVSPHGMLDGWALAFSPLKKRLVASLFQRAHLQAASVLHALTEAEAAAIRAYGLNNPIAVIPNGVDLPDLGAPVVRRTNAAPSARRRTLLYLGRIHPKKGLEALIDAWLAFAFQNRAGAPWRLVIAGWDELGCENRLRAKVLASPVADSVEFSGPLWGEQKDAAYRSADAFILPSLSEGLPMAVLEAWSYGKPALITPACNLAEGVRVGAAIEIQPNSEDILRSLHHLAGLGADESLRMGAAARRLVEARFTWTKIAADMLRLYRSVAAREPVPEDLRFTPA